MNTIRIIPCLDVKNGKVVKGVKFKHLKYAGDPVSLAKYYSAEGADEIVFLDITATLEKRKTILDVVEKTAKNVSVPLTVGGGIKNLADIRSLLHAGADKVAINTAAVKNPELIKVAAKKFGSQCIVVAIDAKRIVTSSKQLVRSKNEKLTRYTQWEVYINAGTTPTGIDAILWAKKVEKLGAGEILLTSIDADGTNTGYDIELTKRIVENVSIPVIASGGAGKLKHFYDAVVYGKAHAVLAASVFHYGEVSIREVKKYLKSKGIEVRVSS
ncbi:MAG: imidazole glycerol phosphate synthase subunit HisF [Elusimicrobiota bacterium]|nr:imidazole glycerol phosphate synthase subunit HisF [Elusimicrobiota bacterium]